MTFITIDKEGENKTPFFYTTFYSIKWPFSGTTIDIKDLVALDFRMRFHILHLSKSFKFWTF